MSVEIKMSQRQVINLKLTHKDLIELAMAKATGIGNWKLVSQSIVANSSNEYNYKAIDILGSGCLCINVTLEAPAIG